MPQIGSFISEVLCLVTTDASLSNERLLFYYDLFCRESVIWGNLRYKNKTCLDIKSSTDSYCCESRSFDCCLVRLKTLFVSSFETVKKGQVSHRWSNNRTKTVFLSSARSICFRKLFAFRLIISFGHRVNRERDSTQKSQTTTAAREWWHSFCLHNVRTTWIWERWTMNRTEDG